MGHPSNNRGIRRWLRATAGAVVAGTLAVQGVPAAAQPADAPHAMTGDEFAALQGDLVGSDSVVQDLAARVAESRAAVGELELQLGALREDVNRALVDLQAARAESARTAAAADASGQRLEETRARLRKEQEAFNELARAISRQGRSTSSAFGGADDAGDALDRAGILRREADRQQLILDDLVRARTRDANADAQARQDQAAADAATAAAEQQRADAESAIRDVTARLGEAQAEYQRAQAASDILARQLEAARAAAAQAPEDSRNDAARGAAQDVADDAGPIDSPRSGATTEELAGSSGDASTGDHRGDVDASSTTTQGGIAGINIDDILGGDAFGSSGGTARNGDGNGNGTDAGDGAGSPAQTGRPSNPEAPSLTSGSRKAKIETVINRAMGQLGVPYAWGGGDANGPTKGIRDGGVADRHGDYNKIGFDCSGLTLYAYAGVGIELPHYTGYQYQKGTHYPKAQMQRGDLLFWGKNGHGHVALYLGDGQMIEAPQSGDVVKISKVRYDSMTPNVVRLL